MSFFGFDTTLPRDKNHPSTAPGFSIAKDPFAGLSQGAGTNGDGVHAINFEDTYDGLGDQLDEGDDAFNNDTFGAGGHSLPVDKDFDFFGQTAKVSDAITEEQLRYSRQPAPPRATPGYAAPTNFAPSSFKTAEKPVRTGYEKYKGLEQVSDLQVDPTLWGAPPSTQTSNLQDGYEAAPYQAFANTGRKMLSLEEVEAQMRLQPKKPAEARAAADQQAPSGGSAYPSQTPQQHAFASPAFPSAQPHPSQGLPRHSPLPLESQQRDLQAEPPSSSARGPQVLQRPQQSAKNVQPGVQPPRPPDAVHRQRMSQPSNGLHRPIPGQPATGPRFGGRVADHRIITHPKQLMQLSEEERAAYLVEEAKRAKRNHKIFLLSKDNGLMTPQDKNFITRIQLQQLMAASGNADDKDPDAAIAEDFYYQVFSQIRSGPRQNPHQPLSQFAQTYLFQTGSRHGGSRRHNRGENHMQRMEQQVQRAVEAAKAKPKNTQLSIEGSLGKIALSNSKAPRAVLSIKRPESGDHTKRQHHAATRSVSNRNVKAEPSASDARTTLQNTEAIYTTLMKIEEDARKEPPPPSPGADPELVDQHVEWSARMHALTEQLWRDLKVHEPVDPDSPRAHPFIAILAYPKGKKAIPRAFRFLSPTQRLTTLTIIFLHLDVLDVVRGGRIPPGASQPPSPQAREAIELFSVAVLPSLFAFVSDAPLFSVIGLLGLILDRVRVAEVALTRVGLSILTMLTSRATLIREAGSAVEDAEWQQWMHSFDRLFDTIEPVLPAVFPMPINSGEDMYIWQFLAAMGSGASPEQQSRLVIAVKDRVMETVTQSKTLPPDMASQRLGNVNLFMRAIGLDVELLG